MAQRLTQPLSVKPDPRVTLPDAVYAQQFDMARQIGRSVRASSARMP